MNEHTETSADTGERDRAAAIAAEYWKDGGSAPDTLFGLYRAELRYMPQCEYSERHTVVRGYD